MRHAKIPLGLLLAFVLAFAFVSQSQAKVFKVNTSKDQNTKCKTGKKAKQKKKKCSLRSAVQKANKKDGQDRIKIKKKKVNLDSSVEISSAMIIKSQRQRSTVDAGGNDRAFDVTSDGAVSFRELNIINGAPADGESGGAIRSAGIVEIEQSSLNGNAVTGDGASGGAVFNDDGSLTVLQSTLDGNSAVRAGGAIEADGSDGGSSTTVRDSILSNNSAGASPGNGGAFHQTGFGFIELFESDVIANTAAAEGGGLWNSGSGSMEVNSTNVANNSAGGAEADNGGGGIYNDGGNVFVVDATSVVDNSATGASGSGGGVLNNGGKIVGRNSIISTNTANRAGGAVETVGGEVKLTKTDMNENAVGDAPGNGGALHVSGAGSVEMTDGDVRGNSAAAEGGGLWNGTGTMTLNSVKVLGNTAGGNDAAEGGGGIYQLAGGTLNLTGTAVVGNSATGTSGSGGGILNDNGTINLSGSLVANNTSNRAGGGIETNVGEVNLTDVRLVNNSTGSNPGNGGGLHVTGAGNVSLDGGKVANNTAAAEGGGLWNGGGTMTLDAPMIKGNTASGDAADQGGGGVYNLSGTVAIQNNASIDGNVADGDSGSGGGVLNEGTLTVTDNSTISDNRANRAGGGVEATGGPVNIANSTLHGNDVGAAPGNGGGLHVTGDVEVNITGSKVTGNTAASEGGGLWNNVGTMTVDSTLIRNNTVNGDDIDEGGGGVYQLPEGTLAIQNGSSIVGNSAPNGSANGGGAFVENGTLTVADSQFVDNDASRAGGAIEMRSNEDTDGDGDVDGDDGDLGTADLDNVLMSGNSAGVNGGGIHFVGDDDSTDDTFVWADGTLLDNTADNNGGGAWNLDGEMIIGDDGDEDVSDDGNEADNEGDVVYHEDGSDGTLVYNDVTVAPGTGLDE